MILRKNARADLLEHFLITKFSLNKTVKETKQTLFDKRLIDDKNDNVDETLLEYLDIKIREMNDRRCEPLIESKCE